MLSNEDKTIIHDMVIESIEQLDGIADEVMHLEENTDQETINKIFRIFHSVKGNIGMIGFANCGAFAHKAEDIVSLIRDGKLIPDKSVAMALLKSLDVLHDLLEDIKEKGKDDRDISQAYEMLREIELSVDPESTEETVSEEIESEMISSPELMQEILPSNEDVNQDTVQINRKLKMLIAEDDFRSRLLMQEILSPYGTLFTVVNGEEAIMAFLDALRKGEPYDLICLDIMMPVKDGQTVLKEIREAEQSWGIPAEKGAKIIMVTALKDPKNIMKSYYEMCNAYIFKPIRVSELLRQLAKLGLADKSKLD